MEIFNLQDRTRIGAMNRAHCTRLWSAPAERSDDGTLVWSEERRQFIVVGQQRKFVGRMRSVVVPNLASHRAAIN